ncbi:MAG: BMP family ABC transporter substrate-binding protein [Clostridiales bacterium]|nr:BMP family ABC transporter substrate-binding protein [Clostridiales bacterium]
MKRFSVVVMALVLVFILAACGGNEKAGSSGDAGGSDEALIIGFIYIGAVNDGGYTQTHHNGTVKLQDQFGDLIKCVWIENVDDTNTQSAMDAAKQLIDQGAAVVIGTSFGFGAPLFEMAESGDYDDIIFMHFSGSDINDHNYGNYFGAMEEPRYLSGVIAGMQTTSNKLGYVAAYPYTEVKIGINAFALGAQSVNPNATVSVVYINSWYDPAAEKQAAEALLAQGCDVITQHADTPGPQLAAAEAGAFAIGYNLDNSGLEGLEDAYLTAPVWRHDGYLIPAIRSVMDGTWKPDSYYGTIADGYIDLAPMTKNVTDEAKAKVEEIKAQIEANQYPIFTGPIFDNEDNEVVPEGVSLDRGGIWQMEYLVKGVTASE